jgi:hypothetical protein
VPQKKLNKLKVRAKRAGGVTKPSVQKESKRKEKPAGCGGAHL